MESLRDLNLLSIIVRLILAVLIGGVLGFDRDLKNKPAGFRTYMLVCAGSALVMMTNQYVHVHFDVGDIVRMGAQVVSGIGFLGAGTIIMTGKNRVRGITTAAGLWTSACCGLAIGIGFYEGAIAGGLLFLLIVTVMQRVGRTIHKNSRYLEVYLEVDPRLPFSEFIEFTRQNNIDIAYIQMQKNSEANERFYSVILLLHSRDKRPHDSLIQLLTQAPGVSYFEELH